MIFERLLERKRTIDRTKKPLLKTIDKISFKELLIKGDKLQQNLVCFVNATLERERIIFVTNAPSQDQR